jgi:hypothetical protein
MADKDVTQQAAEAILEEMGKGDILSKAKGIHIFIALDDDFMGGPKGGPMKKPEEEKPEKEPIGPKEEEEPKPEGEEEELDENGKPVKKGKGQYNFQK